MSALQADCKSKKKKKKSSFWSIVFSHSIQQQWTVSWSDCDIWQKVDSIQQPVTTSSAVGPRSSKALPKAKLAPKKVMVTIWWSVADLIHYSCLHYHITSKKYDQKIDNTKICNTCSQHWSTEWAQFFSMTIPDCTSYNQRFKSWTNWAIKFYLICHIHLTSCQTTTTSSSISKLFARKLLPQPSGGRKCFLRVCGILKHRFLCYRNKQTYISLAKMC